MKVVSCSHRSISLFNTKSSLTSSSSLHFLGPGKQSGQQSSTKITCIWQWIFNWKDSVRSFLKCTDDWLREASISRGSNTTCHTNWGERSATELVPTCSASVLPTVGELWSWKYYFPFDHMHSYIFRYYSQTFLTLIYVTRYFPWYWFHNSLNVVLCSLKFRDDIPHAWDVIL